MAWNICRRIASWSPAFERSALPRQVSYLLDERRLVDLVGELSDDDLHPSATRRLLDARPGPDHQSPAAVAVGVFDGVGQDLLAPALGVCGVVLAQAVHHTAGREIGTLDYGCQFLRGGLRVVDEALLLGVGDGSLTLTTVQQEGSRSMAAMDWARGRPAELGRLT